MGNFFHTHDGRLRGLRLGACCYLFNTLLSLISDGWRSISWIPWLLMASGFFAMSEDAEGPKSERSKWHSPAYLVGVAATVMGLGILFYRVIAHLR
jgi:hypothetical protein